MPAPTSAFYCFAINLPQCGKQSGIATGTPPAAHQLVLQTKIGSGQEEVATTHR